jgi:DnaJ-class molecular chaperone
VYPSFWHGFVLGREAILKTLYAMLGVGADASAEEIAAGYQRMIAAYPNWALLDDNQRAQFVALREAHATLSDPVRRSLYDQQRRLVQQSPQRGNTGVPHSPAIEEMKVSGAISPIWLLVAGTVVVVALAVW